MIVHTSQIGIPSWVHAADCQLQYWIYSSVAIVLDCFIWKELLYLSKGTKKK
jgi:hypothetical protein